MATPWSGFSLEDQAKIKSELNIKKDTSKNLNSDTFLNINCD